MKTLERYIAGVFLKNFLMASLGLTAVYMFQKLIGDLIDVEFPFQQTLFHDFLQIPSIYVQMAPPAALLATVLTLSGLSRTNELIACFSIGFGLKKVLSVIVALVFMICCLMLVLQDRILPPVFKKRMTYYWREMKKKTDFFLDVKQDKIWYRSKNLIYNLRTFELQSKTIYGMAIYNFSDQFELKQVIEAEKAVFTPSGWRLLNGTMTSFVSHDPFPVVKKFSEKDIQIEEKPNDFQEIEKEVDGLRLKELYRYIQRTNSAGADTKGYQVKFHSRISLSFIPLVMCFLGVPFSVRGRREGGVAKDLGICMAITFFYWLFYSVGLSLGTNGALLPWLAAWLPSMVFAALAAVLIARQGK